MRRRVIILSIIAFVVIIIYTLTKIGSTENPQTTEAQSASNASYAAASLLPGDTILTTYADPAASPESDITWLARALDNYRIIQKNPASLPLATNEEIAAAMLGKRPSFPQAFLSPTSPALNAAGQFIDRWKTPLYFHAHSTDRIDIRSAGPDGIMWNDDDIHRFANGTFADKNQLRQPSLYQD